MGVVFNFSASILVGRRPALFLKKSRISRVQMKVFCEETTSLLLIIKTDKARFKLVKNSMFKESGK
ncbi:hypothetical protein BIY27_25570 [Gibbsiella quercinecans]|nr:hypothetical protein BIY27_25570 [Gibbsiella quercinecans]